MHGFAICREEQRTPMSDDREALETTIAQLEEQRKALSGEIGVRKGRGEAIDDLLQQSRALSAQIKELRAQQQAAEESPSDDGQLHIEVLTSAQQVGALRDEWSGVLSRCSTSSPFLTWEWMMSWYETYEDEGAVRCLVIRDASGGLVGLAPLFLSERRDPKLGRRQIGFASTYGDSGGSHLQLIHAPEMGEAVGQATAEYLDTTRDEWNCAKFLGVPVAAESAWPLIGPMVAVGWHVEAGSVRRDAVALLPQDGQDPMATFPSLDLGEQCRKALRQLQDSHPRHMSQYGAPEDGIDGLVEKHILLSAQRPSSLGLSSRFQSSKYQACFTRAAKRFAETGRLRVARLDIEGEVAATLFCLLCGETLHLWSSAWSPQWADYDVSHLVIVEALKGGMREGAREALFLESENPYEHGSVHHLVMELVVWQNRRQIIRSTCEEVWGSALGRVMPHGRR
jgi:hypothetical protein